MTGHGQGARQRSRVAASPPEMDTSERVIARLRVMQQVRRDTAILKAQDALHRAEKQFTAYAEDHYSKGNTEWAATNYSYAHLCADALENLTLVCNPEDGQLP